MVRTQIQLTEQQSQRLHQLAAEQGRSVAELIREGVDRYLGQAGGPTDQECRDRAIAVAGRFHSGLNDLAAEHDRYLAEDLAR